MPHSSKSLNLQKSVSKVTKCFGRGWADLFWKKTKLQLHFLRLSNCCAMVMAPPIVGVSI